MAAHQAPPSLGFSRQEYWIGLPFPSPVHESEVAQSCPTLRKHMDCSLPDSSVHRIFQARVLELGCHCLLPSPLRTPIIRMLVDLMLSQRSLRLSSSSSFFSFFFFLLYSVLQQWFSTFCFPDYLPILLSQLFCCWYVLVYFSFVCSFVFLGLW